MIRREIAELFRKYRSDEQIFHDLMPLKTREVLLVASAYDAFTLEQDGLLSELLVGDYLHHSLSNPPRITNASGLEGALEALSIRGFDLAIVMSRLGQSGHVQLARRLREAEPRLPLFLLLNDNVEVGALDRRRMELELHYDGVFVWNGHSEILLAMIKLLEDRSNVENDTRIGLTRVILLVEDSIRYASRYLPILYGEVMGQTRRLAEERDIDDATRLLRTRARPKVMLATSFEAALELGARYKDFLLCLITDARFPKDGAMDGGAGLELIRRLKAGRPDLPTLLQSSEAGLAAEAEALGSRFLHKHGADLGPELASFFHSHLGFGDFVFRDEEGVELARASTLDELRARLCDLPEASLLYHASRNHFSAWLMARGEIQVARLVQRARPADFGSPEELRHFLMSTGELIQRMGAQGRVMPFSTVSPQEDYPILRLAEGPLGGKGRGIAFAAAMLARQDLEARFPEANVRTPRSAVIGTDAFADFRERNRLDPDPRAEARCVDGELEPGLMARLGLLLERFRGPLVARSSSLLEDALSHPFSGLYRTFFLPNTHPDPARRLAQLAQAIRLVYASVYAKEARAYFEAIDYRIEEERMGILIQEVAGRAFGSRFYPHLSGVAQSCNYYPLARLEPKDGIAILGLGLGKYVVEGERAFRYCPAYPQLDMLQPQELLQASQRRFYALDLARDEVDLRSGEEATLLSLGLEEAERDGALAPCASVWDAEDQRLREGLHRVGPRVLSFAGVVKYDSFPLTRILKDGLALVEEAMGTPVELEFAVDLGPDPGNGKPTFYLLQVKHQLQDADEGVLEEAEAGGGRRILHSERGVGHGRIEGLRDVLWVDPEAFDPLGTRVLAEVLERWNDAFRASGGHYLLLGPGRWGSRDPHLGIPVAWPAISCARVIVEYALPHFQVDASLGSHFFHNVISLNVGYLSIPCPPGPGHVDWAWLRAQPELAREGALVHTRLGTPLRMVLDGRRGACSAFAEA